MKKYSMLLHIVSALLLSTYTAFAQIELETTLPGKTISGYTAPPIGTRMDFTGDGVPDLVFIPSEFPVLIIQDGANPSNSYLAPLPPYAPTGNGWPTVMGYFELDGRNDNKEIILVEKSGKRYLNPIVIDIDGKVLFDGSATELLTIADMDGDTYDEIVVFNPEMTQVEIWGERK